MTSAGSAAVPATPCAPVLVLLFNRPGLVRRAIEALRPARPARVYLAADGPRWRRRGERALCAQARTASREAIDWPCEVRTLFRWRNLGCARAVHGAISWFFQHEAEGVILEDDCIAAPDFLPFCTELLARYRGEPRVFAISGDNFVEADTPAAPSYWFNGVFHCWGWATWRERWRAVPRTIPAVDEREIRSGLRAAGVSPVEIDYWAPWFERVRDGTPPSRRIDSWAYPAVHHVLVNRLLCATPSRNLVANVGFGEASTHFRGADAPVSGGAGALDWPLQHPGSVTPDARLHRRNLRLHFGIATTDAP